MSRKKKNPVQEVPVQKRRAKLPTREQQEVLRTHGLHTITWEVVEELPDWLSLRHRITGERKVVSK